MRYQSKPKPFSEGKIEEIRFQLTLKITMGWLSFP